MKIEQFSYLDVKGPRNILATTIQGSIAWLLRLKLVEPAEVSNEEEDAVYFLDQEYSGLYDDKGWESIECYLNLPETSYLDQNPLNYAHICELQQQDGQLLALQVNNSDN